ncbi:MAG: carbohydrate ABC transporter permease, partial [Fervidobacterium sp.]
MREPGTKFILYFILIGVGYAYLYPLIYMLTTSMMSVEDLVNPTVNWIHTKLTFENFVKAWNVLEASKALINSVFMSVVPAIFQTIITAVIAYGLARFEFPLKNFWFILILSTF